jgi:group I intron endonuclease
MNKLKCLINNIDIKTAFGIYLIRQVSTNKVYIGSTTRNFYDRVCAHRSVLRRNIHSSIYFQRAWNKYGQDDFQFEIVEVCSKPEDVISREIHHIKTTVGNGIEIFNITKEVSPNRLGHEQNSITRKAISKKLQGIKRSDDTKKKMSESKSGANNPSFGKKQTAEVIAKRLRNNYTKVLRSDGKQYSSLKEAALELGILWQSISQALRKGYKGGGFYWSYVSEPSKEESDD